MPSPTFPPEEMVFLRALLDMPEDRNTWLVYADWLDDRSDPRAEFLRLMVAHSLMAARDPARKQTEARLKQLRAELDPNWMMMFDPAPAANCSYGPWTPNRRCGQSWADMAPTDVPDIRICRTCRKSVIYCHTLEEAREYASCGQIVALSSRTPLDALTETLQPPQPDPAEPPEEDDWYTPELE
jgi:uncharacterized protein (TIGR02996 family)